MKDYKVEYCGEIDLDKRKSAHEKLIEMGYKLTKYTDYVSYRHKKRVGIVIYNDKTYSCNDTNLELSRILTQYLEELEEEMNKNE